MLVIVTIIIAGSVLIYAYSTGLIGNVEIRHGAGHEALNMDSYAFINSTTVSIAIRNTGVASVTLVSYQVKDGTGNTYTNTAWTSIQGAPQQLVVNYVSNTTFSINTGSCGCTLSGSPFTFVPTNSYSITVTSARNNLYMFTVVR